MGLKAVPDVVSPDVASGRRPAPTNPDEAGNGRTAYSHAVGLASGGTVFLDIDGNKVFALSFGSGPRTLLAHSGWVGNVEDWIATLAPLSASWRTVVYDHRGTGETVVPPERITSEALVDDVFRVMDTLGIERCVLGGFSRGVSTVLRAALRAPERFDGLVLMNGHGEVRLPDDTTPPRPPPSQWPGATHADRLHWFAERCTPEPDVEHVRRWARNILSRATEAAAERLGTLRPEPVVDWPDALAWLRLPTLIVHGEHDPLAQTPAMHHLASLIPGSRLVVMEGSGHLPAMTRPQDVAREIDSFLRSLPG